MEQGKCPKCGSQNLNYDTIVDITPSEQSVCYPFECLDCGCMGSEYYNLVYTESVEE